MYTERYSQSSQSTNRWKLACQACIPAFLAGISGTGFYVLKLIAYQHFYMKLLASYVKDLFYYAKKYAFLFLSFQAQWSSCSYTLQMAFSVHLLMTLAMAAALTHSTQYGVTMSLLHCGFPYPDRRASSKQSQQPQGFHRDLLLHKIQSHLWSWPSWKS